MKTIIIVQCRLSSSRLPQKALYRLDGTTVLSWALRSMKKVKADDYFVACDYDSEKELKPLAEENGFKIFAGPKDDVLERFCMLIERENADVVLRATADNPFLFFDAAQELLDSYKNEYFKDTDYITYSGLPHGSGIEIFNAKSLLNAKKLTGIPYDHEHVGPSLYNHQDKFKCLFLKSPEKYFYPSLRTTIDTYADYIRACDTVEYLASENIVPPYKACDVVNAFSKPEISKKILYVPSVKKGQGTGHFLRCIRLAKKTKGCILITDEKEKIDYEKIIDAAGDFPKERIIEKIPLKNEYDLIVLDRFKMTKNEAKVFSGLSKTVAIDEGSKFTDGFDFLLNIIPSELKKEQNRVNPCFIEKPHNVNASYPLEKQVKKVLVCFGGEDNERLTEKTLKALCDKKLNEILKYDMDVTVVTSRAQDIKKIFSDKAGDSGKKIFIVEKIENLKEHLCEYDIVITHYGLTAFECVFSNTPVLLCAPSSLHKRLSLKNGFKCLSKNEINASNLAKYFVLKILLNPQINYENTEEQSLDRYIFNLAEAALYKCPLCGKESRLNKVVERTEHHTFRRCSDCSMVYISYSDDSEKVKYEKSYFADEYKKQYGKTYLEDFESIKKNCISRIKNIDSLSSLSSKNILDIGCAYGPFLSAAKDFSWIPFGADIASDAVEYVNTKLGIKAVTASFADIDIKKEFNVEKLDAVTMWYVIEHIKDLNSTLKSVNALLNKGGIFAFSTPNASGVSSKADKKSFYTLSPKDHYSLWEIKNTSKYLKRFGFKVCKTVSTGIHPERVPFIKKHGIKPESIIFKIVYHLIKLFKNGDTYEVYCRKTGESCDER